MTGILATLGATSPSLVRAAVDRLAFLGRDVEQILQDDGCVLAVTRMDWELDEDFSGPVLTLDVDDLWIAADATLYGRDALVAALHLAGVRVAGTTPSHLLAAAYRAWGPSLVRHLRGDYAFVIWDSARRRLVAARDPLGSRPLFHSEIPDGVAVASSSRALALLVDRTDRLNLASIGAQAAGLAWASGSDSAYEDVDPLPPGHVLVFERNTTRIERFWRPPTFESATPGSFVDAADELRTLLGAAVLERAGRETTVATVWMSGGWDSTAVFAAGQHALPAGERGRLRPVSISYPVNDPGREDELIDLVAAHWSSDVTWLNSENIPLLDGLEERAGASDEPPAHLYELWNRALARGTRAVGGRIALDGCGGDQLFQVSDVIVADLIRRSHWLEAARFVRARGRGWRHLMRLGVLPLMPASVIDAADRISGTGVPRHYLERSTAEWIRPDFLVQHELRDRDIAALRRGKGETLAQSESILFLTLPIWSWGASYMRAQLLDEDVEVRSPLLDLRIVEFALARPAAERACAAGTKMLLRRAMTGMLPEPFLAPRTRRTGTTVAFSRRRMREGYPALFARLFAAPLRLADLGIVEPAKLRSAADRLIAGDIDDFLRINLFHVMKVEFWLRGLDRRSTSAAVRADATHSSSPIHSRGSLPRAARASRP